MSDNNPGSKEPLPARSNPALWLIVPTLSLLCGQAAAILPPTLPARAALLVLIPAVVLPFRRSRRIAALIVLAAVAFSIGYVRHRQIRYPEFEENHLRSVMQREGAMFLEGVLREEPQKLPSRTRWIVHGERVWYPTGAEEITGDVLINIRNARREWHYGDHIRVNVRPVVPRDSGNPGGFDYRAYLADREIYATAFLDHDSDVELVARQPGKIFGAIEQLRREIRRFVDRNFSHDNGALLKALTVGDMGEIPKGLTADFTAAGVNHVLSISGLHVGMLGLVIFAALRFGLGFNTYLLLRWNLLKIATFCSFIAVVFYTALAGAMVPTVRSAVMIGVYELAVLLDREEEVLTSLTFAALLIALVWPGVVTDISFQLSFLAVFFIAWGMRRVQRWIPARRREELPQERSWWKEKLGKLGYELIVPLLATLGTAPLIAHYFGHLSLAGFVSNPVVVPLVGFVVVPLGLTIGFLAVIGPAAAAPLVWLAEHLLSLTIWLVHLFAQRPLANISVPSPDFFEVSVLYALMVAVLLVRTHRYAIVAVGVIAAILALDVHHWWQERWRRSELRVTHLDVGQGDAAVIELPGSKVLLVDAGGSATGEFDTGDAIVAPFLRSRKIVKLDYAMVTQARVDHYGGMRSVVKEFTPTEFWAGPGKAQNSRFEELEEVISQFQVKRRTLTSSEPCRSIDAARLCVVHPPPESGDGASVVFRLEFGKVRLLFAGDADKREEQMMEEKNADVRSAVIKVPRHGSATSSTQPFVHSVRPRLAIVSAGARNRFGFPKEEVVARYRDGGAEILRTDEDGAITLETDGSTIRYSTHRSGKSGTILVD